MHKAFKFRLLPTKEQEFLLAKTFWLFEIHLQPFFRFHDN